MVRSYRCPFKYERLSNLCYWCGSLTHDDRDCELWLESEGTLPTEAQQLGPWIRAPPYTSSRRTTVTVPGFYSNRPNGCRSTATAAKTKTSKPPPVVVRRTWPSPEIIRPGKERAESTKEVVIIPDFQEQNPRELHSIPINQVMTAEDIFKGSG